MSSDACQFIYFVIASYTREILFSVLLPLSPFLLFQLVEIWLKEEQGTWKTLFLQGPVLVQVEEGSWDLHPSEMMLLNIGF